MTTAEELIEIARDLVERLVDTPGGQFEVKTNRMANLAHVPLVHAYSTHTLRLGSVGVDLLERGLYLEAVPTVRAAYEAALTASWLADSKEAPAAVFNEDVRQRKSLAAAMALANSPVFREGGPTLPYVDLERLDSAADVQAKWFKQLCEALHPGGPDAYVIYKALSAFTHPSAALADQYVQENADHPSGMRLLTNPNQQADTAWLAVLVSAMVWAGRSIDVMVKGSPNRDYLREVARRLGIPVGLRLSQAALAAEARAEQQRRRSAWKGAKHRGPRAGRE